MVTSLALLLLFGLAMAALFERLHLPRIIGLLIAGIILGPCALNLLDMHILTISGEVRQMALIVILLRAGLSLNPADLKKVGRPALLLSCIPASFEILGYVLLAPSLLGINRIEAAVMGAVLSAVSPAVVVPRMLRLMDEKRGTDKGIPQMIMAGASCDDIFVIVLFSTFTGMAQGGSAHAADFVAIPISILLGIALGAAAGMLLALLFSWARLCGRSIRGSLKVLILLGTAFLMIAIETWLKPYIAVSGLLAVISMACAVKIKSPAVTVRDLSGKLSKVWLGAEILLFVLVGAAVDIRYTFEAGAGAILLIFAALLFRSLGVALCLLGTRLNRKERLFCMLAYLPKATVQAAIGSVPLSMGLACGNIVLSVAVLGILLTAPLGAICMDASDKKLLRQSAE